MNKVNFSIIMPTYNRGYIISRAIQSVISQTYKNWELIIVDDGSKDDTEQRVIAIKDDRIRFIHYDRNQGANHARNLGMKEAKGQYFAFLDSDNEWHPDYLEKQLIWLENSNEQIDVVFARSCICNNDHKSLFPCEVADELDTDEKIIRCAMFRSVFDTNVVCMTRKVWEESREEFNENLRRHQDWEYFLRLLVECKYHFKFNNEVLDFNDNQKDSITNTNDLFWDARLYIFEKYIDICRKTDLVVDVLSGKPESVYAKHILSNQAEKMFSLLNAEEKMEFYKRYHEYKESQVISEYLLEITKKNNKILTIQKKWISMLQQGKRLDAYFQENNIESICIYGFGILGELLYDELKNSDIQVKLIIDGSRKSEDVSICKLEEVKEFNVDVIVVTAVAAFEEISETLKEKTSVKVVSLEDIIYEENDYIWCGK